MVAERGDRVAVVVPAFQAVATIGAVVAGVRAALPGATAYVVDDGSTDGSEVAAARAGGVVIRHPRNEGKGAALADGIRRALRDGTDWLLTLDADGQHPPEVLPRLLALLRAAEVDLVLGARCRSGGMPAGRRFTNWLSAVVASRVAARRVPDAQTGLRAFSAELARALEPAVTGYTRYDYEAAFLLAALRGGYRVRSLEVPTVYNGAPSHFAPWADSWRVARVFARYLLGFA
jgi:glycosyltransferase involved in cell wall biosynthesis